MASTDCRKFAPNIFNKSKCSNCFRLKEEHSAQAIELNKASRKISKCGYLFVAPDWDFSNPTYRTKRWQRRWFVLYDDGELSYSVDDYPDTIPQACIDMNKVMEVARADEVTGNPFSVAITAPDRIHFVKGTCKEESLWWLEVLQIFPRTCIKTGRAKRNATFPGGVATTYMAGYTGGSGLASIQTPPVKQVQDQQEKPAPLTTPTTEHKEEEGSITQAVVNTLPGPSGDCNPRLPRLQINATKPDTLLTTVGQQSVTRRDTKKLVVESEKPEEGSNQYKEGERSNRYKEEEGASRYKEGERNTRYKEGEVTSRYKEGEGTSRYKEGEGTSRYKEGQGTSSYKEGEGPSASSRHKEGEGSSSSGRYKEGDGSSPSSRYKEGEGSNPSSRYKEGEGSSRYKKIKSKIGEGTRAYRSLRSNTCENLSAIPFEGGGSRTKSSRYPTTSPLPSKPVICVEPPPDGANEPAICAESPAPIQPVIPIDTRTNVEPCLDEKPGTGARGVPDGGSGNDVSLQLSPLTPLSPLSPLSPVSTPSTTVSSSSTIPFPSPHELLNLKKGWLMKQGLTKEWHKHWFVLQGTALMYFRDPTAENNGLLDGIVDLGLVQKVEERDVARNYGFIICTLDDRQYVLSAVTHGIRNNWINALKTAANILDETDSNADAVKLSRKDTFESDTINLFRKNTSEGLQSLNGSPRSPRSPIINRSTEDTVGPNGRVEATTGSVSPLDSATGPSSPLLARSRTSRAKGKYKSGRTLGSKPGIAGSFTTSDADTDKDSLLSHEEFSMIPERDTSTSKSGSVQVNSNGSDSVLVDLLETEVESLKGQLESAQSELYQLHHSNMDLTAQFRQNASNAYTLHDIEAETAVAENTVTKVKMSLQKANDMLHKQTVEIGNLRRKLDMMNFDMDATLKNLNDEQVKNNEMKTKLSDMEQSHSLLEIKSSNAEKSLREQSKEITSLNNTIREFGDLRNEYKEQVAVNKTLRQKIEKLERINNGPNWKSMYENLQDQHHQERSLWENKIRETENELQSLLVTQNEVEQKTHIINDLSNQLQESETRINELLSQNEALERDTESVKLKLDNENRLLKENIKELEEYIDKSDSDKREEDNSRSLELASLKSELAEKASLTQEIHNLKNELLKSENEIKTLKAKLLEEAADNQEKVRSRSLCSSRDNISKQMKLTRMDSLSELTASIEDQHSLVEMEHDKLVLCYQDVLKRFHKAISEIKALKASVKISQNCADELEITNIRLKQRIENNEHYYIDQQKLNTNKIEDLTNKYLAAERQVRAQKLKMKGMEGKERRRSSTGIRPEEILINREAEHVLDDIELNLTNIEEIVKGKESTISTGRKKSYETSTKASRARRRSSESSELSFVDRMKKTEKCIADVSRKLSCPSSVQSIHVENVRRQILSAISKCKVELSTLESSPDKNLDKFNRLLQYVETVVGGTELPVISVQEPGFPKSDNISSHLDTVMTFLYRSIEQMYNMRKNLENDDLFSDKVVFSYNTGVCVRDSTNLAKVVTKQKTSLQAYLLLDLQQQVASIETKVFSFHREQTLQAYNDVTKTMFVKMLEMKNFMPLSDYSSKKIEDLSSVELNKENIESMFRRLQTEAHQVFAKIGSLTQDLICVLTDAISCDISNKQAVLDGIRSEVLHLLEEDERLREFQTCVINVFLVGSEENVGRDAERVAIMTNRQQTLQSQAEVGRILLEQELQDLLSALETKLDAMDGDEACEPQKEFASVENLSQCIFKIANMMSQKCVTEAQITILNTILGRDEMDSCAVEEEVERSRENTFVFNPEDMNNECNEFMLVLNSYMQQTEQNAGQNKHKLSFNQNDSLESNLKTIRKENENKKARLSAALNEKKIEVTQDQKTQELRAWCESSMTAMEKSYENLLSDLQSQHIKEKEILKKEKESSLAEETQATLHALDAMRKAHEAEVQKEVEKFKKEFLMEFHSNACIGALQSEYKSDRNEIRREILSATGGEIREVEVERRPATRLTRSPSCPRLYSSLSVATTSSKGEEEEEPLRSPLTGMVANRKRVFETEY